MKLPLHLCLDHASWLTRHMSPRRIRNDTLPLFCVAKKTYSSLYSISKHFFDYSDEVLNAIHEGKPIVTLESAIITHGMPNPTNIETALKVQDIVREQGAVPATLAVIKGRIKVGLTTDALIYLGGKDRKVLKTSYRDLPYVLSQNLNGGTTVSTTLAISKSLGVSVMVTGGIGGVHRGGETSMDISADLIELGQSPVGVVCSGVKSILDIERTLEYLETQGVLVATFGSTRDFPAFYSVDSGFQSPYNVETTQDAAGLLNIVRCGKLRSGAIIAVPVPEEHSIPSSEMEEIIQKAVEQALKMGVRGKDVTPYVLSQVVKSTDGRSLRANVALIKKNAEIGAKIAVDLAKLEAARNVPPMSQDADGAAPEVMVIGGAVVDNITKLTEAIKGDGRSHRALIVQAGGGVGRNIADALGRIRLRVGAEDKPAVAVARPLLLSAVGDDLAGQFIVRDSLAHTNTSAVQVVPQGRTAAYSLLLSSTGECHLGAGDMGVFDRITPGLVEKFAENLQKSALVVLDGNIPQETIDYALKLSNSAQVPVWFEPTDIHKAAKPFQSNTWRTIDFISPNFNELRIMCKAAGMHDELPPEACTLNDSEVVQGARIMALFLGENIRTVIATLGHRGVVICRRGGETEPFFVRNPNGYIQQMLDKGSRPLQVRHYPAPDCQPVSVSGAGDCWNSGFIGAALQGESENICVEAGFHAALHSLAVTSAVPPSLNIDVTGEKNQ